jgi:hypothetical protein
VASFLNSLRKASKLILLSGQPTKLIVRKHSSLKQEKGHAHGEPFS